MNENAKETSAVASKDMPRRTELDKIEGASACMTNESLDEETRKTTDSIYLNNEKAGKDGIPRETQELINKLIDKNAELELDNKKLRESSNDLTKKMAKLSSRDPRIVNVSDDASPVQLGKLSDSIYANEWYKAFESLSKTEENEFKILESLSNTLQKCYKRCQNKSEAILRQFLLLEEEEDLPSDEETTQLLQLRRSIYHKKDRRERITKDISHLILEELEDASTDANAPNHPLSQYISRCTELCWLVVTSFPPLYLAFDVKEKRFKDIQSNFQPYSAGNPVFCDSKDGLDKVASVIWPALVTNDRADLYMKGTVLVYNKTETIL